MIIKRLFLIAMLFTAVISASGCWDQVEVENRLYLMAIGVDYIGGKKPYLLTFEIPVIKELASSGAGMGSGKSSKGAGGKPAWMLQVKTDTIANALDTLGTLTYKQPFVGHLKVVVISEKAAKHGVLGLLDFLERDPSSQRRVKLALCKGKARDIMNITPKMEKLVAISLSQQITISENTMKIIDVDIGKFESKTWDYPELGVLIPMVSGSSDAVRIAGAGVMCEGKLEAEIGADEIQGYNWLSTGAFGGTARLGPENVKVEGGKTSLTCHIDRGMPIFNVAITARGRLEQRSENLGIRERGEISAVSRRYEKYVRKKVASTIGSVRKTGIDYVGFGQYLYKHHPRVWEKLAPDWRNIIRKVPIEIEVSTAVTSEGLIE